MHNELMIQNFLLLSEEKQKEYLKSISDVDKKSIFFDLKKETREKAFNLLNPESQTQFMQSLSLGDQREFFDTSTRRGRTIAFNALEVNGRKSYLKPLSELERDAFTDILRKQAVSLFWTNERELIKQGLGTRDWTPEQMEAILNLGVYKKIKQMSYYGLRPYKN